MVDAVKSKLSKDTAGAGGAGISVLGFTIFQSDVYNLVEFAFQGQGLEGEVLESATKIATGLIVVLGTVIVSYFASRFMNK